MHRRWPFLNVCSWNLLKEVTGGLFGDLVVEEIEKMFSTQKSEISTWTHKTGETRLGRIKKIRCQDRKRQSIRKTKWNQIVEHFSKRGV